MPSSIARRLLFLALLVGAPIPYYLLQTGRVPPIFLAFLTSEITQAAMFDGGYVGNVFAKLLVPQVLLVTVASWGVARLAARYLPGVALVALAGVLVASALLMPLYRTPYVRGGAPQTLMGLFQ